MQIAVSLPSRRSDWPPELLRVPSRSCLLRSSSSPLESHRGPTRAQFQKPSFAGRIDKLYDRNLNAQIFQKVRCKLCSLSSKRSLPRRSGRGPLGFKYSYGCPCISMNVHAYKYPCIPMRIATYPCLHIEPMLDFMWSPIENVAFAVK